MKLCENIQFHRKRLNITQDDLGKMLFVSRQTISMWENGQTVPTLDNLVRLGEIFSVSVDELLKGATGRQDNTAKESYHFHFSNKELKEIEKEQIARAYKKPIGFTLLFVFLFVLFAIAEAPDMLIGVMFGCILIDVIVKIKGFLAYKKAWKTDCEKITQSTYEYFLFDDHFEVNLICNGQNVSNQSIAFEKIEVIQALKSHYIMQIEKQLFIIPKQELKENSILQAHLGHQTSKTTALTAPIGWWLASVILFVLSLASIWIALILVSYISSKNLLFLENMWIFFLLTPLPISSAVLGFVSKRKEYPYKKNIIAGVIMTVLLCIYGSFVFLF